MPTTWNPNDAGGSMIFSNGDLTMEFDGGYCSARSTTTKTTGKWYFEVRANWVSGQQAIGSIMTAASDLNIFPGQDSFCYSMHWSTGANAWIWYFGNTPSNVGGTAADGDVLGFCIDIGSVPNWLYFTKNGANLVGDPVAGTDGIFISPTATWYAAGGGVTIDDGASITGNFGLTGFAFGPPSGFESWDPPIVTMRVNTLEAAIRRTYRVVGV